MKKILIVFYSRTGTTKKVADKLKELLNADIEEVVDTKHRFGLISYLVAVKEATMKKLTTISKIKKKIKNYKIVIIGTPVWAHTISVPIRTFLNENKQELKKVGFFCTLGATGGKRTIKNMEKLCNKKSIASLILKTTEVVNNNCEEKIKKFINNLNKIK